jgi:hypothetical protein
LRPTHLSSLLVFCALGAVGCAQHPFRAQVYEVNDWKLEVSLVPEKSTVLVGEPVFLAFLVRNLSAEDLQVLVGGDTLNRLRRPGTFKVQVVDADGRPMPTPESPPAGGSSARGPQNLPVGGTYRFSLFLPDWTEFKGPGEYTVTAARTLEITRSGPDVAWLDPANVSRLDVQASARVAVHPSDAAALGAVIATRGQAMFGGDEEAAIAAANVLAAIDDARVIPHLTRAAAESSYSVKSIAVRGLARFNDDQALEAVTRAAHDPELGIRLRAAHSLSSSPHPAALAALIELRTSPDVGMRNTVLQALAKDRSPESLEMIRAMTTDDDEDLRTEAQRYLRLHQPALGPSGVPAR